MRIKFYNEGKMVSVDGNLFEAEGWIRRWETMVAYDQENADPPISAVEERGDRMISFIFPKNRKRVFVLIPANLPLVRLDPPKKNPNPPKEEPARIPPEEPRPRQKRPPLECGAPSIDPAEITVRLVAVTPETSRIEFVHQGAVIFTATDWDAAGVMDGKIGVSSIRRSVEFLRQLATDPAIGSKGIIRNRSHFKDLTECVSCNRTNWTSFGVNGKGQRTYVPLFTLELA